MPKKTPKSTASQTSAKASKVTDTSTPSQRIPPKGLQFFTLLVDSDLGRKGRVVRLTEVHAAAALDAKSLRQSTPKEIALAGYR